MVSVSSAQPLHYGSLRLPSRYLLSPLAGFTNLPFRRVVRELGGLGLATTDLVSARALLEGSAKSFQLIETCPEDRPFAVQIFDNTVVARFRYHAEPKPPSEMLTSPRFWAIQMWLVLLLLAFAIFRELTRALGPEKTREVFLGPRRRRPAADGPGLHPAAPPTP